MLQFIKPTIISRHILKSYLPPFLVGVSFFSFVILLFNLRFAIKAAIEKGVDVGLVFDLVSYSMGWTLGLTIPMSAILGTIISVSTLNGDQEIIAMRAGGMTFLRIFRPYFIFSLFVSFFMIWYQFEVIPICSKGMSSITLQIYNYNPTAVIEAGQFTPLGEEGNNTRFIFVESMEVDPLTGRDIMLNVQVRTTEKVGHVHNIKQLIFALEGRKIKKYLDDGSEVRAIRLFNGYLLTNDKEENSFQRIDFTDGSMDLNLIERSKDDDLDKNRNLQVHTLSRRQLEEQISKYEGADPRKKQELLARLKTEFHKRISLPMSIVLFSFLGFPIGIVNRRSGKGMGLGQSVVFIFLYFGLYLSSDSISMVNPEASSFLIAWTANITIFFIGLGMFLIKTTEILYHPKVQPMVNWLASLPRPRLPWRKKD